MIKLHIKIQIFIISFIFCFVCNSSECQNLYRITHTDKYSQIKFADSWYFNKIAIPVHSFKIWGDNDSHNIAVIEFEDEKHIISSKPGEKYLEFNDNTKAINSFKLTSISSSSDGIEECLPLFRAASSKTKEIEDNLLLITNNENDFLSKNQCFSCHRMIPTAILFKTAYEKGFNINETETQKLIDSFSKLQKEEGSFYFEKEPIYGIKTTTLSAAFISSLFSEISRLNFLKLGNKAKKFLSNTHKGNEIIMADFIFEPFFNNETTSLLFEIIFQKTLYLKDSENQKDSNERANQLFKQSLTVKDTEFNKKILLLFGIPYSYQITSQELTAILTELNNHISLAQSKISTISGILSLFVLKKLSPKQPLPPIFFIEKKNFSNKDLIIWNCLQEVLYNSPNYLNGTYDEK